MKQQIPRLTIDPSKVRPVPLEDTAKLRASMKTVLAKIRKHQREQAKLIDVARRRIVF